MINSKTFFKAAFIAVVLLASVLSANATIHTISVANFSFSPANITTVVVGDTIRWVWVSGSHTTTSTTIPSGAAGWDSPISQNVNSFDYKVTTPGTYNYVCSPHAGSMAGSFTASQTTSLNSNAAVKELAVYPNPFKNLLNINNNGKAFEELIITDILGKQVFNTRKSEKHLVLDQSTPEFDGLPEGAYFLTLIWANNEKYTTRIIKAGSK